MGWNRSIFAGAIFAALLLAAPAEAKDQGSKDDRAKPRPRAAPEFDPAAAGAIASLLAGATVLLARRRRG